MIIAIIRPLTPDRSAFAGDYDSAAFVEPLYEALYPRLEAHDLDQEIKECAITSVGRLLTHLGTTRTGWVKSIDCVFVCVCVCMCVCTCVCLRLRLARSLACLLTHLHSIVVSTRTRGTHVHAHGIMMCVTGDHLSGDRLPQVLALLMEKLRNEITRTPALKALAAIATSPLHIDLSAWDGILCLCVFGCAVRCFPSPILPTHRLPSSTNHLLTD